MTEFYEQDDPLEREVPPPSHDQIREFERLILEHVAGDDYRPAKPKAIAKQLKIDAHFHIEFRRIIKRLVKEGKLSWGSQHLVTLAKAKAKKAAANEVLGRYRRAKQGFGFVTPDHLLHPEIKVDIHIPFRFTLDAADNDIVKVKLVKEKQPGDSKRKDGLLGRILEVVERNKYRFVGTYSEEGNHGFVAIDNNTFDQSVAVGDAGAKNCRPDDKVVVEIVRFPSVHSPGEGVIVEVLGARGKPGVDTLTVMREFELPESFPEAVLAEAHVVAEEFDETIPDGRADYTHEVIVTIDPKDARDFDDAISLKRIEKGHWLLGVHIADVSHFVRPNTNIDNEAYKRGTSVYLPDRVIPMLPEVISNSLASLQPDRVRYVVTAWIEFTPDGARVFTEVKKGAIKSRRRFTYEEIDEYLADRDGWKSKLKPEVHKLLADMHELAMILRKRRDREGSIELIIPDVKIDLDNDGKVIGAHNAEYTESHQIIEEFMLSANEAVAEKLNDLELPYLRRIHESPDPRKLGFLTEFVRELGIECESLESRFEIKRVLQQVADSPIRQAVNFSILRSMKKAKYSPREIGHYALASDNYCHFTSPIRRYPDLVIHRMMASLEEGVRPATEFSRMLHIGDHCSRTEEVAEKAERQLIKLKLLNFFAGKIGTEIKGFITGVDMKGFYVQGYELPVEGFVPLSALPRDIYDFEQGAHMLIGRRANESFRLGDSITVVVASVDLDNRELRFDLGGSGHGKKRTLTQTIKGPAKEDRRGRKSDKQPSGKKQKTFKEKPKQKSSNSKPGKKKTKAPPKSISGRQKKKR